MKNLQLHQLRVAAVARQICDTLTVKVDTEYVVKACLLHDMGNIIKFNLEYFPDFNKPEGIDYWKQVQREYIEKYGSDEHHATIEIVKELGYSDSITVLINAIDHDYIAKHKDNMSIEEKLGVYADNRVTPHGIVSLRERSEEARVRYKDHPNRIVEEDNFIFIKNLEEFEKEIFSHSSIKPIDVNDKSAEKHIEELRNFEI